MRAMPEHVEASLIENEDGSVLHDDVPADTPVSHVWTVIDDGGGVVMLPGVWGRVGPLAWNGIVGYAITDSPATPEDEAGYAWPTPDSE